VADVNRQYLLKTRPEGRVTRDDFDLVEAPLPDIGDGEALVRLSYLSLDPTNRVWMSEDSYLPKVGIGEVMRGAGVGEVVASNAEQWPVGSLMTGLTGWQDYVVASPQLPLTPLPPVPGVSPSTFLGVLGLTGITAYFGLLDLGKPQEGETVVVSAAAGAVGSIVGQLAKIKSARAVGIAGSDEKCALVVDELGFDACVNYKAESFRDDLRAACPDGVDVNFENVGGTIMEEVIALLNLHARMPLCGLISGYNDDDRGGGPRNFGLLLTRRIRLEGFIILDYYERWAEAAMQLAAWLGEGRIKAKETVVDGLESAPDALNQLFDGGNVGKLVVKV
jgi:NADPH-dependent curcumin reductase CurA